MLGEMTHYFIDGEDVKIAAGLFEAWWLDHIERTVNYWELAYDKTIDNEGMIEYTLRCRGVEQVDPDDLADGESPGHTMMEFLTVRFLKAPGRKIKISVGWHLYDIGYYPVISRSDFINEFDSFISQVKADQVEASGLTIYGAAKLADSYRTKLRSNLVEWFNDSELRDLCSDMGVDYESLTGEAKSDKARELVAYCERRQIVPDLVAKCKELRPKVSWEGEYE